MYLLDQATKVEEGRHLIRSYLIENGQVRYVNESFGKWKGLRIAMSGTIMMNGRVVLDESIVDYQDFPAFQRRQIELITKGCTTVAVAPHVPYERQLDSIYRRTRHAMVSSTIDYLIGFTLMLKRLTPRFIRHCQKVRVPFIRILLHSHAELNNLPWTHISQALTAYPIVLIPVVSEYSSKMQESLLAAWTNFCSSYRIHTSPPLEGNEVWNKGLLQKVGLYPEKGRMLIGSDADYLLFIDHHKETFDFKHQKVARNERIVYHEKDPMVVIIKGNVIKAGEKISLKPGYGRCLQVKRPGRFLTLDDSVVM